MATRRREWGAATHRCAGCGLVLQRWSIVRHRQPGPRPPREPVGARCRNCVAVHDRAYRDDRVSKNAGLASYQVLSLWTLLINGTQARRTAEESLASPLSQNRENPSLGSPGIDQERADTLWSHVRCPRSREIWSCDPAPTILVNLLLLLVHPRRAIVGVFAKGGPS